MTTDFSMEDLSKAIGKLKNNKAAGLDRIPAELIKNSTEPVKILILKIMNKLKDCWLYPKLWALGITTLLHKEGDENDPNNYRAITITSASSKILAIMLNERLEVHCKQNNIICKEQIGFEKHITILH